MKTPNILLVEDDEAISDYYSEFLADAGFNVTIATNSASALENYEPTTTNLVLLDISLGDDTEAGFQICSQLRGISQIVPIIFLTSHDSDLDKISGLRLGADDYITKDNSIEYLIVRIKTLFHRLEVLAGNTNSEKTNELIRGDLYMNMDTLEVTWKDQPIELNLTQIWMVHALASNRGHVRSPQQLMKAANVTIQTTTIVVHIRAIRQEFLRVDPDFAAIKTERSVGYRWITDKHDKS